MDLNSDKNFEMCRIHLSYFLLHGGDDGAGGFDEEQLERRETTSLGPVLRKIFVF